MTEVVAAPATPAAPSAQPTAAPSAPASEIPASQATETPQAPAGETPAKTEDTEADRQRRHRRQLNTAYRKEAEARARAEIYEKQLNDFKASQTPAADPAAPKLEQFSDIEKYAEAKAKFESDKAVKALETKRQNETQQQQATRLAEAWESKVDAARDKYDDFDDVVGNIKPVTPALTAIMELENGPDVAHYLVKNGKEAARIDKLSHIGQILELGRLSAKLAAETPKPKTPSKAPAPITPVTGTAPVASSKPSESDDMKTWMAKRNKQVAARR